MNANLSAFLAQNAVKPANKKIAVSPRFIGEDGKPIEWEIACITAGENQKLRKESMRAVPVPGKRGQFRQEMNLAAYQAQLAVACTVFPDLTDITLQESYGAMSPEQLISMMLTPGEFDDYILAITELCGFMPEDELVEEAKN